MTAATDIKALQARIAELEARYAKDSSTIGELQAEIDAMVAAQAQEPVAWLCGSHAFTDYAKAVRFAQENMRSISNLYAAPPAPASLSLVQAALEAAAKKSVDTYCGETIRADAALRIADAIRAIDPQQIIEGVGK